MGELINLTPSKSFNEERLLKLIDRKRPELTHQII